MITYGLVKQNSAYARDYRSSYTDSDVTRIAPKYPVELGMGYPGPSEYAKRTVVDGMGVKPPQQQLTRAVKPTLLQNVETIVSKLADSLTFPGGFGKSMPYPSPPPSTVSDPSTETVSIISTPPLLTPTTTEPSEYETAESQNGIQFDIDREIARTDARANLLLYKEEPVTPFYWEQTIDKELQELKEFFADVDESRAREILTEFYQLSPETISEESQQEAFDLALLRSRLELLRADVTPRQSLYDQAKSISSKSSSSGESVSEKIQKLKKEQLKKKMTRRLESVKSFGEQTLQEWRAKDVSRLLPDTPSFTPRRVTFPQVPRIDPYPGGVPGLMEAYVTNLLEPERSPGSNRSQSMSTSTPSKRRRTSRKNYTGMQASSDSSGSSYAP